MQHTATARKPTSSISGGAWRGVLAICRAHATPPTVTTTRTIGRAAASSNSSATTATTMVTTMATTTQPILPLNPHACT